LGHTRSSPRAMTVPGRRSAIIDRDLFDAVQAKLNDQRNTHTVARRQSEALLVARIYDDRGNRMTPSHVRKGPGATHVGQLDKRSLSFWIHSSRMIWLSMSQSPGARKSITATIRPTKSFGG
jgi:hypothetical protein